MLQFSKVDNQAALHEVAAEQGEVVPIAPFFTAGTLMRQAEMVCELCRPKHNQIFSGASNRPPVPPVPVHRSPLAIVPVKPMTNLLPTELQSIELISDSCEYR